MAHPHQGGVNVGQAGMHIVHYDVMAGPVANALAAFEAGNLWITPASTAVITNLLNAGVTYPVETLNELFWWARIRLVSQDLLALARQAPVPGESKPLTGWKTQYQRVETERARYQQTGNQNGVFTFLTRQYALRNDGPNHYYASRNGANISYNGRLTAGAARKIITMLNRQANNQAITPGDLNDGAVDEFVCAYFAEPTRWAEEQAFNLLALKNSADDRVLTSDVGVTLLPMAIGTTWLPAQNALGAQVPRRIVAFAQGFGLTNIIQQELATAASLPAFLAAVRAQYDLQ